MKKGSHILGAKIDLASMRMVFRHCCELLKCPGPWNEENQRLCIIYKIQIMFFCNKNVLLFMICYIDIFAPMLVQYRPMM